MLSYEKTPRWNVYCFIAAAMCFWYTIYAYSPIVSTYAQSLGASFSMVGVISSAYGFTQLTLRIPIGIMSDRLGSCKPFVIAGLLSSLVSGAVVLLWKDPVAVLISRALTGVTAATWVPMTVMFTNYFESRQGQSAISVLNSLSQLGKLVANLLCGYIIAVHSRDGVFIAAIISASAGLAIAFFLVEAKISAGSVSDRNRPDKGMGLSSALAAISSPGTLFASFLSLLSQYIGFATVLGGFTPVYAKSIGADDTQISLMISANTLMMVISAFHAPWIYNKLKYKKTLAIIFVVEIAVCVLVPLSLNVAILYALLALDGIVRGVALPLLMNMAVKHVPAGSKATAMGMYQAIYAGGIFAGPLLTGVISDNFGFSIGYYHNAAMGLLAIAAISFYNWRKIEALD